MKKIGITLGDPSGISPEVLLKAVPYLPPAIYIVYGSKGIIDKTAKSLKLDNPFREINSVDEANRPGFYLINIYDEDYTAGNPTTKSALASIEYLERAVEDILEGKLQAITTLPISKEQIMNVGFKFPGHTDYMAYRAGVDNYIMMLACEKMKVALATAHIPLREVPKNITTKNLEKKIRLLYKELEDKFGIRNGKVGVLGLNPHAGDNGKIGSEEVEIINPLISKLKAEGYNLVGALPPDTAFVNYKDYDCYFAMYHDQGLIPLKLLCFKQAVNITLGLPFVRTSVDHGTGFDIAGKGKADYNSFLEAVKWAIKLGR
jgi:4-hydroxythreonine-4-phosphate dehydrogenase